MCRSVAALVEHFSSRYNDFHATRIWYLMMSSPNQQDTGIPLPPETFPQAWLTYLQENVVLYGLLPPADQDRLRRLVPRFIESRFWEGCCGLRITDEIRVTIAAQACLLVLGFDDYCFEDCKTILVYPGGYLGIEEDQLGFEVNAGHRLGEAHHGGPVVLSWWHACWGGRHRGTTNVVLHEFAHKLAERGDLKTGIPPLDDPSDFPRWESVLGKEYEQLREDAVYERPTLLDPYGASSPAEFFAVASECFFLRPLEMRRLHPQLYQLLAEWYRQDPAEWPIDAAADARSEEAHEQYLRHAIAECDAALRHDPDYRPAYWHRAECCSSLGEFDKALADYTHLIQLVPKGELADAYYERGWVQREMEDFEQAIADFSEAIRHRPGVAAAYRERGTTYACRGEYRKALADLTHAHHLDPYDDVIYLQRGRLWCKMSKYERAISELTRALHLCPHRAETYIERALAYLGDKQYDRALADCDEALRLDPHSSETYHVQADIYEARGEKALAQRSRDEAARREKK
jgi:Mlc titration factor MtfA (ptsG expression regulator)/Tfp pilus assembly protein PilF